MRGRWRCGGRIFSCSGWPGTGWRSRTWAASWPGCAAAMARAGELDRAAAGRFAEATIADRLHAVMSFDRFHELKGVPLAGDLCRITHRGSPYKPLLEHVARRRGRRRAVVTVRGPLPAAAPGTDTRGDREDLRRVRVVRPGHRRLAGPGPGPAAMGAFGGVRAAPGRSAGAAAPGLAHRPRRQPVRRGGPA